MTEPKQPEALRLAGLLELAPEDGVEPQTTEDAAAELRRLHAENTILQQGYAAARLEIESLQARIKTMAEEHADELTVAHLDGRMRAARPAGAQAAPAAVAGPRVRRIERTSYPNSPAHMALSAFCHAMHDRNIDGADMRAAMLWFLGLEKCEEQAAAAPTTQPAPQQEATSVDLKTMELAESVGLIGPASRTHDLHAAIQRFHDLICANATIKAAQMAAGAISDAAPKQEAQEPVAGHCRFPGGAWAECSPEHVRMVRANSEEWKGYEVRYLYAEPQPSPASQGDALDAARYRIVRRGQHWSVINGIGDSLRGEELDAAIDAARKQGGA